MTAKKNRLPENVTFAALNPQPKPEPQETPAKASAPRRAADHDQDGREKVLMGVRLHPDDIARLKHFALDQHSTVSDIISSWIARYAKQG